MTGTWRTGRSRSSEAAHPGRPHSAARFTAAFFGAAVFFAIKLPLGHQASFGCVPAFMTAGAVCL